MAWGDTRDAAQDWASTNVPNYQGSAYGMNRPGNWESGWSPTRQMSERPYQPKRDSEYQRYLDVKVNQPMNLWEKGGGADWMSEGTFTNIPRQANALTKSQRGQEIANRRGIASLDEDEGMGMVGHAKQFLGGMKWPSLPGYAGMMADSIAKNQAQHKDLDQYFQSRDPENWRNAKNASFFENQGFDTGDLTRQGGQARGYFNRAGITDQVLSKFMDKSYKFGGNEAWLRSQAEDKDQFDQGMSFIKNAVDTSGLHESVFGTRDMRDYDEHYDIAPDDRPFDPGYEGNEYDLENQIKLLENQTFPGEDDITSDTEEDYTPYPDEKWGAPINYNPYRDEDYGAPLYGFRKGRKSNLASLFGIPAFMDTEESYGLMPGAKLPYDMYEDEEINPDMLNPDYFNQFTPG